MLTLILTTILTLMLTLMLTLIYLLLLPRFDLCVMLTFRPKLQWGLGREGGNCESKHGLCGSDVILLAGLMGLPGCWQKSRYNTTGRRIYGSYLGTEVDGAKICTNNH